MSGFLGYHIVLLTGMEPHVNVNMNLLPKPLPTNAAFIVPLFSVYYRDMALKGCLGDVSKTQGNIL